MSTITRNPNSYSGQHRMAWSVAVGIFMAAALLAGCGGPSARGGAGAPTATPVPDATLVYAATTGNYQAGTLATTVYAINARTQAQRWTAKLNGYLQSPLFAAGGAVFLQSVTRGKPTGSAPPPETDYIASLDLKTGQTRWQVTMPAGTFPTLDGAASQVVVALVTHPYPAESNDLVGMDPATGAQLWKKTLTGDSDWGLPAFSADAVLVAPTKGLSDWSTATSRLLALSPRDGSVIWQSKGTINGVAQRLVIADGVAYLDLTHAYRGTDNLAAFDATTGAAQWTGKTLANLSISVVAVSGGRIYALLMAYRTNGTVLSSQLAAFDAATGASVWQQTAHTCAFGLYQIGLGQPAGVSTQALYLSVGDQIPGSTGCASTSLEARSLASGSTLWTSAQQGNSWLTAPVVAGDTVYAAANATVTQGPVEQGEHDLLAYNAATGAARWRLPIQGMVTYPPLIVP